MDEKTATELISKTGYIEELFPYIMLLAGFLLKSAWGYFNKNIEDTDSDIKTSITNIFKEMKSISGSLHDLVTQFSISQEGDKSRDEKIKKLESRWEEIDKRLRHVEKHVK